MFKLLLTSLFLGLALAATDDQSSSHHASPQETTIVKFDKKSPPKFSSYMLTAIVELPNSDIFEPFAVFYDATRNRSRVDYRNGVVKTLQFGTESGNRMFSYVTTPAEAIVHRHPCYTFKGSEDHPILPQSAFPANLDQFSYAGDTAMSGIRVSQWHFEEFKDKKKRTFDFYTHSLTNHPIRYEFDEFDTRLDTFVDKQIIEYSFFVEVTPSDEMFELAEDFKCQELASYDDVKQMKRDKLTNLDQRIWLMNPLSEYFPSKLHHERDLVDEKYEHFKRTYKTQYADEAENEKRKAIFRHNLRYIESTNRAGLSYRLALNHFADWTVDELKKIRGFRASDKEGPLQGTKFDRSKHNIRRIDKLPESLDVWLFGAVGPVADQKICGSDWAFAAKEAIEGAFFFKNGHLVKLAAQELVDCSRSVGNEGCDGGAHYRAYEWVKQHGLSAEQDYAPYVGAFGTCHYSEAPVTVTISDWLRLSNSSEDLRWALAGNGPVSLAVDASHRSFLFYAGGIYSELKCKKSLEQGDVNHSLVAVGYGKLAGRDYIMLKNSWSSDWGNSGLILFDTDPERNCGLYSEMSQPLV